MTTVVSTSIKIGNKLVQFLAAGDMYLPLENNCPFAQISRSGNDVFCYQG
jgi:nitrite reductase/ring-hydroxylating ferredoxin subunit